MPLSNTMRPNSFLRVRSLLPCLTATHSGRQRAISIYLSKSSSNQRQSKNLLIQRRLFQNESEYHSVADETLEDIQDAVEMALEDEGVADFDVTYASGVLTMVLPPHGTYVLNKQTPNRQIWSSSPLSGPRRFEYEGGEWVFTRDESQSMTLQQTLKDEIYEIYGVDLDL